MHFLREVLLNYTSSARHGMQPVSVVTVEQHDCQRSLPEWVDALSMHVARIGDVPSFVEMARAIVAICVTKRLLVACQDYEYLFAQI